MPSKDSPPPFPTQARQTVPLVAIPLVTGQAERERVKAEFRRRRRGSGQSRDSLYMSDEDVARHVLGEGKVRQWVSLVPTLEREGLPTIDPLFGGRFWPSVRAWLEHRHGLKREHVPSGADGKEVWSI